MRCVVYTRVERVVYVVGLPGAPSSALGDALLGVRPEVLDHRCEGKGFRSMSDKNLIYIERVGLAPLHRGDAKHEVFERARRRAVFLNMHYADLEVR